MVGASDKQGIIEIYGLMSQDNANKSKYQRSAATLKAMMEEKDYRYPLM